jgi:hypothetical protein
MSRRRGAGTHGAKRAGYGIIIIGIMDLYSLPAAAVGGGEVGAVALLANIHHHHHHHHHQHHSRHHGYLFIMYLLPR